jgi:hypothetical protein
MEMRYGNRLRLTAILIGTVLVLWACADGSDPVAPVTPRPVLRPAEYGARTFATPRELLALGRFAPLNQNLVVSRTISPEGGIIVLREAGIALRFPAGAVATRTRITVTAHGGDHTAYTFEPHGLQFAVPVEVAQFFVFPSGYTEDHVAQDLEGAYLPHGVADIDASGVASVSEVYPVSVRTFAADNGRFVPALATFRIGHFSGYTLISRANRFASSSGYMLASGRTDTTAVPKTTR